MLTYCNFILCTYLWFYFSSNPIFLLFFTHFNLNFFNQFPYFQNLFRMRLIELVMPSLKQCVHCFKLKSYVLSKYNHFLSKKINILSVFIILCPLSSFFSLRSTSFCFTSRFISYFLSHVYTYVFLFSFYITSKWI